jgi:hypothetical protein
LQSESSETYSFRTTVNNDLLTVILPLYSIKPSFLNLFMKKFTRDRLVPTMLAMVSCELLAGGSGAGRPLRSAPKQQRPCQAFFAEVEEWIDQVFLDANVVREHVGDKMVGQFVFGAQYPQQLFLLVTSSVDCVEAVVVPVRSVWPAMQPSPKKSPGPNIATTASLPDH